MRDFEISNSVSGQSLGTYSGETEAEAYAALLADAGYSVSVEGGKVVGAPEEIGGQDELVFKEVTGSASKAWQRGFADGEIMEREVGGQPTEARRGDWLPDEGLINGLDSSELYDVLGLTPEEGGAREDAWDRALDEYNEGFFAGVRSAR